MARIDPSLAAQFDKKVCDNIVQNVQENSKVIEELVNEFIFRYCSQLDDLISKIKDCLSNNSNIENYELDRFIIEIPMDLYYTSEAQESLGIEEDVSKAMRQFLFNQARECALGTVADKDAKAESAVEQETLVTIAYTRASRKLKHRIEMALELLASLKKVATRRISEMELTRFSKEGS